MADKISIEEKIKELEQVMASPDFWQDKAKAQARLQTALEIKPYFSLRYAPKARSLLAELSS